LFYLANEQLRAYEWRRGRLSPGPLFGAGRAGLAAFSAYLEGREEQPAWLVADLIEEDYQRATLPHVGGKGGRALIARKLNQLYRETPYRYAAVQNRDPDGRRDDHVLFSALTNPAALQPWVQAMEQRRIPLAGIHSLTALGAALIKPLALDYEHLLLVTQQAAGLRQSYYQDGRLKFSRLTPALDRDGAALNIVAETEKTQQFLTSTRLLARGQVLYVTVLGGAAQMPQLQALCQDSAGLAYHFVTLEDAAERLRLEDSLQDSPIEQDDAAAGLADGWADGLAEPLLLAHLASKPTAGLYERGASGRFYQLWLARQGLRGASAATLAVALLCLCANLWGTWSALSGRSALRADTARLEARYRSLKAALPASAERPENMKAAALIEQMVAAHGPMPAPLLAIVSHALDGVPQIQLTALDWQVSLPGSHAGSATAAPAGGTPGQAGDSSSAPPSSLLIGVPAAAPQTLRIEAEVALPQSDYRAVLDSVNRFAQDLARTPRMQVVLEQPPLDVRSTVKLAGKAASDSPDASASARSKFILQLVWNP
jgi:hypothetical protein